MKSTEEPCVTALLLFYKSFVPIFTLLFFFLYSLYPFKRSAHLILDLSQRINVEGTA